MAAKVGIAGLIVEVNNEKVSYKQGTLEFDTGDPEIKTEGLQNGSGSDIISTEDATTAVGMVKFTLPSTVENNQIVREWKLQGPNNNTIILSGKDDFALRNASFTNKLIIKPGVDSEIAVEFSGDREND